MLTGLPVAFAMLAQAPAAMSPAPTPAPAKAPAETAAANRCPGPNSDGKTIVICTERPQGYRLDPDVMEAKRQMKNPGRPVRPGGRVIPDCAHVGPAPCVTAGINLLAAAATAAEMSKRLSSGQEVGSMFVTDPQPTEYQRYQMAKARREAEAAEKAAKAAKAAAEAKAAQHPVGN
jgi:hypothetical protein